MSRRRRESRGPGSSAMPGRTSGNPARPAGKSWWRNPWAPPAPECLWRSGPRPCAQRSPPWWAPWTPWGRGVSGEGFFCRRARRERRRSPMSIPRRQGAFLQLRDRGGRPSHPARSRETPEEGRWQGVRRTRRRDPGPSAPWEEPARRCVAVRDCSTERSAR